SPICFERSPRDMMCCDDSPTVLAISLTSFTDFSTVLAPSSAIFAVSWDEVAIVEALFATSITVCDISADEVAICDALLDCSATPLDISSELALNSSLAEATLSADD